MKAFLKKPFVILFLLGWAIFLLRLEQRPMATRGEAREAIVAQSIVEQDRWILGYGYGGVVPSKPPLMHWLIALASSVPGEVNNFTARLPSAVAAIGFVLGLFIFLAPILGEPRAALTSIILLTSLEWIQSGGSCRVDMLFATSIAGGLLMTYRWLQSGSLGAPLGAITLFSAAVLTKGPAGIIIPAMVIGLYQVLDRVQLIRIVRNLSFIVLPVLILGSSWYVMAYLVRGPEFFTKFYYENVSRMTGQEDMPHSHSVLYLYLSLLVGLLPWSLALIPFLTKIVKLRFNSIKIGVRTYYQAQPISRFSLCATFFILIFFSIPDSKRAVYLLPAYPFLAILMSAAVHSGYQSYHKFYRGIYLVFTSLVAVIFTALLALQSDLLFSATLKILDLGQDKQRALFHLIRGWPEATYSHLFFIFLVVAISYTLLLCLVKARLKNPFDYGVLWGAIVALFSVTLFTQLYQCLSAQSFAQVLRNEVPEDATIYSYDYEFYGVSFYANRLIKRLAVSTPQSGYLVIFEKDLGDFKEVYGDRFSYEIVDRSQNSIDRFGRFALLLKIDLVG